MAWIITSSTNRERGIHSWYEKLKKFVDDLLRRNHIFKLHSLQLWRLNLQRYLKLPKLQLLKSMEGFERADNLSNKEK